MPAVPILLLASCVSIFLIGRPNCSASWRGSAFARPAWREGGRELGAGEDGFGGIACWSSRSNYLISVVTFVNNHVIVLSCLLCSLCLVEASLRLETISFRAGYKLRIPFPCVRCYTKSKTYPVAFLTALPEIHAQNNSRMASSFHP